MRPWSTASSRGSIGRHREARGDSTAPAATGRRSREREKAWGSSGWPGEEAREPAYCIRCGVGFLVAILLDIDRETHEYSLIRRGCVRRRSPLVSLRTSFYVYMCEYTWTRVPNPPTLSNSVQTYIHMYKRAHNLHTVVTTLQLCIIQTCARERVCEFATGRNTRTRFDHEGETQVASVGSLCWFSVSGGGDSLENGDAGSVYRGRLLSIGNRG